MQKIILRKRQKLKLSLRELARLTGISFSTLSRIERGDAISEDNLKILQAWVNDEPIPQIQRTKSVHITLQLTTDQMEEFQSFLRKLQNPYYCHACLEEEKNLM